MATNNKREIIGVGRLHFVNTKESQIRYMAVDKNFRKKGVGNAIVHKLEIHSTNNHRNNIILNARENAVIFYSKLDKNHRAKTIFLHKIGTSQKLDKLIYQEKIDRFSVSIYPTSDEKFFIISSGDHSTNKCYYLNSNLKSFKLNLAIALI